VRLSKTTFETFSKGQEDGQNKILQDMTVGVHFQIVV
jgi:hypothetical protein